MSFGIPVRNGLSIGLLASTFLTSGSGRLVPRLTLNFLTGAPLDSRITFTRSTTATFVGSNGLIQTAAINAPRFDYNPVTLAPNGLLIEEQRVNSLLYSDQFDSIGWFKSFSSITANATSSPDGTTNADRLTADGSSNPHDVRQTVTFTAAAQTISVYAKKDTNNFVQLRFGMAAIAGGTGFANFDLNAGTVGTVGTGLSAASITPAGNGWYRCTITGTTAAASSVVGFYVVTSAAAPSNEINTLTTSVFLYGAQTELGAFATSYIPTVASTVTRTADIAVMTGTNFSSWYNQSEGTIVVQAIAYGNKASSILARIQDAAATTNFITARQSASGTQILGQTSSSGGLTAGLAATNFTLRVPFKITVACAPSNSAVSVNGGSVGTSTAMTTMPVVDRLNISEGGPFYIRTLTYYPSRLTNAQLQALTT